jgi:hypothetical protein
MQIRTVRLAKPLYEILPYVYIASGLSAAGGSYYLPRTVWADVVLVLGILCVLGGVVVLLKRRDARVTRTEYKGGTLDERKLN